MITIKSPREIEFMKIAGEIVGNTHHYLEKYIKPGITTKELDRLAEEFIIKSGATTSFKNLYGFPGSISLPPANRFSAAVWHSSRYHGNSRCRRPCRPRHSRCGVGIRSPSQRAGKRELPASPSGTARLH